MKEMGREPGTKPAAKGLRVAVDRRCRGGRVAFFGGSFDPPHLGHLAVARTAREALGLDRILFAPVGAQPLKPEGSTAPFSARLAMTELAIAGEAGFEISLLDAPGAGGEPNYTLDTLQALRAGLPADGCLFCLMGADSFASLGRWRGAAEIPFAAALIVASRPGQQLDDVARFLPPGLELTRTGQDSGGKYRGGIDLRCYTVRNGAGDCAPFYLLPGLDVGISASEIREQIRSYEGQSAAAHSVPERVAEYIRANGLYRS